jgi:hypothetical protein
MVISSKYFLYLSIMFLTTLSVAQAYNRMIGVSKVSNGFERMWKKVFMEQFGAYLYTGICLKVLGKPTQILCRATWSPDRDLNSAPPEYEAGLPTTRL